MSSLFGAKAATSGIRIEIRSDWIPAYLYPYLFHLININTDMDIIQIQKFISIIILNGYGYDSDIGRMDIIMDITYIIKFSNYRIKNITK